MSDALEILRKGMAAIVDYEGGRDRSPRHKAEKLGSFLPMVHRWNSEAAAAGVSESCPLLPLVKRYAKDAGVPIPELTPEPATGKAKRKAGSKAKASGEKKANGQPAAPAETDPSPGPEDGQNAGWDRDGLLPKGKWLKSHADIIEQEVPVVKSAAADPKKYLAAKRKFLKRNLPKLRKYVDDPPQGHSPLFAYCALFLFDTGELALALKLCEEAVRLLQKSPIKRDYHELQFDLQLMHLEAEAERITGTGKKGKDYDAALDLRNNLMSSPFRGNHAKARVCKIFGTLAHAVGNHESAKKNLLQVKFLDPNMGVETLLAKVDSALKPVETAQ